METWKRTRRKIGFKYGRESADYRWPERVGVTTVISITDLVRRGADHCIGVECFILFSPLAASGLEQEMVIPRLPRDPLSVEGRYEV